MKNTCIFFLCLITAVSFGQSAPENYKNPILSGFYPDPSICRVGDDYYMVNSSFEWFPGMPIHHSKDLVNWELIGYGLSRPNQVELPVGLKDSRGIYAVTIRHHEGLFYLITTCVNCKNNFYVTATNPAGPWSDPVWLNSRGIDPSLFWDEDGKCYYTGHANITGVNDWPEKNGAWIQELDTKQGKLIGEPKQITHGHAKNARWTEGPHLYKKDGKYLLLVAEGGTGFQHSVTLHHSDNVWGPYIPYHSNPVMSHRQLGQDFPIHSVGHADLIQTQNNEWWAVMLGKRKNENFSLLARETFLTPVKFENEESYPIPVFNPGVGHLSFEQKRPNLPWTPLKKALEKDEFDSKDLALEWNFLRTPYTKWYALEKGNLNVQLRPEILDSLVNPSYVARRIQHHKFEASTHLVFDAKSAKEQAGIAVYRNSTNHIQLVKEKNDLVLFATKKGKRTETARIPFSGKEVFLKIEGDNIRATFSYATSEGNYTTIGGVQDLAIVSDEVAGGFSGPYVGIYATSNGEKSKNIASFKWFDYKNLNKENE
ncbi:alpha-N-arabinofuranosidase [Flavobacterium flevense]|nr:glycoside hydrolase family 43 protein [Flavobacterium flevense]SHM15357.1 alpha-N-arabinofuranosidase [Flavobacterium flevense]